jgi:hypothetical protein
MVGSVKEVGTHAPEMRPYRSRDDDIESGSISNREQVAAHDEKIGIEPPVTTYKEDGVSDDSRVGSVRDENPRNQIPEHTQWTWTPVYIYRRWPWLFYSIIAIVMTA